MRFMKYMDSYTHRNLKGYLLIIARNLCCDYFSRKEKEDYIRRTNTTSLRGVGGSREGNSGDLEFAHTELRYLLDGILSRLPEEQREVIVLRFGEELKFKEIAKVVGCSQSTVKSRYRLAMARLRKEMEWVED